MIIGQPEHDWSSVKTKYFFSNNVWILKGMEISGKYLLKANATLGEMLLEDASAFRKISSCVEACVVENATSVFLPPYASLNATPYPSMVASYEAATPTLDFSLSLCLRMCYPEGLKMVC